MFSFFSPPETHPEARSMADYYDDLASAVRLVRNVFPNADHDTGFSKAADVIEQIVYLCHDMEIVSALEANNINTERSKLLKQIGSEGLIDVTGDASKLLAEKYNQLLQDMVDKKYWPVESCPAVPILGQSLLTEYAKSFDARKPRLEQAIEKLANRIADYNHSQQRKLAV